jgi:23S rRNA pseudouridine1911/1915/1917 synthase
VPVKIIDLQVTTLGPHKRLDQWLTQALPDISRSKIQKLITREKVYVDGKLAKANLLLHNDQFIHIEYEEERPSPLLIPYPMQLDILYEDDELLVLNKPAGITVHPGAGTREPTLVEGVFHWLGRGQRDAGSNIRPGIVHRLDKDTSGVMVYAKTEKAQAHLGKQFANKTNPREYLALLDGCLEQDQIEFESYLYRDPSHRKRFASISEEAYVKQFGHAVKEGTGYRLAKSLFIKKETYASRITLASISLRTGRTHQIRVHSKELRCPVLGDPIYNTPHEFPKAFPSALKKEFAGLTRQMLHAHTLGFVHPSTGESLSFQASPPQDFQNLLDKLSPFKDGERNSSL